ncbi:TetR family transcriptional regulator [Pseudomonas segetis]
MTVSGKQLLLEAALRLTANNRNLKSLGIRELAREAGLNPNTFYRHFSDIDDLGLAAIDQLAARLRQPLRHLRREAACRAEEASHADGPELFGVSLGRGRKVCHQTVVLFFDFVADNPQAIMLGVRELQGPSAVLREALHLMISGLATDMAEDIIELELLPRRVDPQAIEQVARLITRNLLQMSLDYINQPEQRDSIRALAEEQVVMLFTGAMVLHEAGQLKLPV